MIDLINKPTNEDDLPGKKHMKFLEPSGWGFFHRISRTPIYHRTLELILESRKKHPPEC